MKLTCALIACNLNPLYFDFWPMIKRAWKEIVGIRVKCILVAEKKPEGFEEDEDLILFPPFDGISDAFISQCIRLLYPALLEEEGVIISDADMIPTCRWWYHDTVASYDSNHFITYRMVLEYCQEVPMCYNAASSKVWGELFRISSIEDIKSLLRVWWKQVSYDGIHGGLGWNTDQRILWMYLHAYFQGDNAGLWIKMKDHETNFQRLCRSYPELRSWNLSESTIHNIINHKYADYHMLRPQSLHKLKNEKIYELLQTNLT